MACSKCGYDIGAYQKKQETLRAFEEQYGENLAIVRKKYRKKMFFVLPLLSLFMIFAVIVVEFLMVMCITKEGGIAWSDFPNCFPFLGTGGLYASLVVGVFYGLFAFLGLSLKCSDFRPKEEKKLWKEFQEKYNQ